MKPDNYKRIRVTIVGELTVDIRHYPDSSDETIIKISLEQWPDWLSELGDIVSEKCEIIPIQK